MPDNVVKQKKPERQDTAVTRVWELSRAELCDILEQNTKSLNNMVQRYNLVLADKMALEEENSVLREQMKAEQAETRRLRDERDRLLNEVAYYASRSDHVQSVDGNQNADPLTVVLKALHDYNLAMHIEPRRMWDEADDGDMEDTEQD